LATLQTTTTETQTLTRTKEQLVVTSQTSQPQIIGNFVNSVIYNNYMAERIISFLAFGMRPNQKLHAFFEKILVDEHCAPGIVPTTISNTSDYRSIQKNGNYGDPITTNDLGIAAGWFRIPGGKFKTGDRVFELSDVDDLVRGQGAISTSASATYTASNISVTKSALTLTTINPELSWQEVLPSTAADGSLLASDQVQILRGVENPGEITIIADIGEVRGYWWEPLAQGLTINTPSGEAGIFATSIDIFFKQKSQLAENGVTLYLCETSNGYPNGDKVLPYSVVHLNKSQVFTSTDSSLPTNFKFSSPIFLNNNTEYAFVIKPDSGDPDYWVYSALLGDTDTNVQPTHQVTSQPAVGTAFIGATDKQWTALQKEYIKFELYRAQFSSSTGLAAFKNPPKDFISIYNIGSSDVDSIKPGDYVFKATTSNPSTACTATYAIVEGYDKDKGLIYAAETPGTFSPDSYVQVHRFANDSLVVSPNSTTIVAWGNTGSIHNIKLDMIVPQIASITPAGTSISLKYSGTSNTYNKDLNSYPVNIGHESEFFDKERIVASRTNELTYMSGNSSLRMYASLSTDSQLVSPVIDLVKNRQLILSNDIDPIKFIYDEFYNNGNSKTKYISRVVTLAPGQDAEDIQVILSAFRPYGSDIQVWVKFLNGEDSDSIADKTWTPMLNTSSITYSAPNPDDVKEFVFTVPKFYGMIPTTGTVTSTSSCTTITGVSASTLFKSELEQGWYINMLGTETNQEVSRKIVTITSDTSMILDGAFNVNYTNQPYFIVPPPTTPWLSTDTTVKLSGLVSTSTLNNTITGFSSQFNASSAIGASDDKIVITNANTYYTPGDRVYYYVPTANTPIGTLTGNTFYYIQQSNTTSIKLTSAPGGTAMDLTAGSGTETHTINTTNFTGELTPGAEIKINGDIQAVVSISNGTSLSVGTPWTSTVTANSVYLVSPNGLSYLNKSNSLYTSFKQFQIKIILQSNDSSKVPLIKNLRALALQL
jgi:hypothetical protein